MNRGARNPPRGVLALSNLAGSGEVESGGVWRRWRIALLARIVTPRSPCVASKMAMPKSAALLDNWRRRNAPFGRVARSNRGGSGRVSADFSDPSRVHSRTFADIRRSMFA